MQLHSIRIGKRLAIAFGLILAITAFVAGIGIWRIGTLTDATQALATTELQRHTLANAWAAAIRLNLARATAALQASDAPLIAGLKRDMDATTAAISDSQKQLEAVITDAQGRALMAEVGTAREAYRKLRADLNQRKSAGADVSAAVEREMLPLAQAYLAAVDRLRADVEARLERARGEAATAAARGRLAILAGAGIAVLLGLAASLLVTRSITEPLGRAARHAEAMADGDLAAAIDVRGSDETAQVLQALARMQQRLATIVGGVRASAENVAAASTEIAQGNQDLSARTERQASSLQQTAASMEQLGGTVRHNADSAQQADQLARSTSTLAVQGGEVVGQVVATMQGINESSRRIADIIGVIDGIAFQTNILALNAAVEAARAGEQGRGFAVVAAEVRLLAQRSATAAREIKALIGTSVERVGQGAGLVDRAGGVIQETLAGIQRLTQIVGEISAASREQSAGVTEIGQAVTQMDEATQQNAALVEQSAAAAEKLREQAQQLVAAVGVFRLGGQAQLAAG